MGDVTILAGITTCDTVRKARRWLDEHDVDYRFLDLRSPAFTRRVLEDWVACLGWETLLNRRSTTWRQLAEHEREGLDEQRATELMLAYPTLIRRPLLQTEQRLEAGFSSQRYAEILDA